MFASESFSGFPIFICFLQNAGKIGKSRSFPFLLITLMGTHDMSPRQSSSLRNSVQKIDAYGHHDTHTDPEKCAQKICTMTFVQTKVCKNISRVSRVRVDSQLFRFLMIAVHWAQSDGTHLYPKKYYLAKIYSSLSQLQVPLRNLELFLAQGGLTPLQVLLKRERALSWPLLQQLANAPLSLFRATHILTLPSVTATVSLYLFFTHCLKILCFIYRVFFSHLYPPKKLKYGKPRLGESTLT